MAPFTIGSPKDVADGVEEGFSTSACDGFVVAASHVPQCIRGFFPARRPPELQRRGLFHTDYNRATLRKNLGLNRPAIGEQSSVRPV